MAYVRKTEELQDAVMSNIRSMKDKALSAFASNTIEAGTAEYRAALDAVETAVFRDAPQLKDQYPDAWRKRVRGGIRLALHDAEGVLRSHTTVTPPDHETVKLPSHVDMSYYNASVDVYPDDCPEVLKKWISEADKRDEKRREIAESFGNVEVQLRQFMQAHSSLNAMLKEMPEFEMYVPQRFMDKFHAASAPRTKKQEQSVVAELAIDRDAIAAIAIANRMTR